MTEEEKKAIEDLKEEIKSLEKAKIEFSNEIEDKSWLRKNINELDKDIFYKNTILNLIEKLQKENEERKSEIEIFYKWLSFTCKELRISEDTPIIDMLQEIKDNYIPKDKIREKLNQEYEEYTNLMKTQQSVETKNIWTYQHNAIKGILEELLEEE